MGSGLVKEDHVGLLAEGPGDEHQLPLAAGNFGVALVSDVCDAQLLHDLVGQQGILPAGGLEHVQVRGTAHAHHLQRGVGEGHGVVLIDDAHGLGKVGDGIALDVLAVDQHLTLGDGIGAAHGVQEGGLAAAVGTQQADTFSLVDLEVDILPDHVLVIVGIAAANHFDFRGHQFQPPFVRRSR